MSADAQPTPDPLQRIGLSATQRPLEEIGRFLGGYGSGTPAESRRSPRPVTIVDAGMRKPLDIDSVVASATTPELALEIYAASFLAIDPDDPAEQAYLAMLASRLKIDPGLAATLAAEARKAVS